MTKSDFEMRSPEFVIENKRQDTVRDLKTGV
jgi:hypothetical protein